MSDVDLRAKLKAAAEKMVGRKAVTSNKYGRDCFALVDKLLRDLGAASAKEGSVKVNATADYDWGDEISLHLIEPGDILQFRDHVLKVTTRRRLANDTWYEASTVEYDREHHTAIVVEVNKGAGVVVVEQNVKPNPRKVARNEILRLEPGEETRFDRTREKKYELKVEGNVRAYRPIPKPQRGGSLLLPGTSTHGFRSLAYVVPSQGGAKRVPGPFGMEARPPDDDMRA